MPSSSGLGFVSRTTSSRVIENALDRAPQATETLIPEGRIVAWNLAMVLFHALLAIVTLSTSNLSLTVKVYRTTIDFVPRFANDTSRGWDLVPGYAEGGSLPLAYLVILFFALSATFHLLNATLLRDFYIRNLAMCKTPTRWIEYSISAPIMMIVIAYSLGIRDRATLLSLAVLVGITMPFGYWTEEIARPVNETTWNRPLLVRLYPWFLGHIPQTAAWFLVIWQFYDSVGDNLDRAPWFVSVILWGELLLFFSFGAAALLSQISPPKEFYRGEILFQILSLVSKGLLGLLMITNVLMLSRFDDAYD